MFSKLQKKFAWFTKANVVKCTYLCSLVFSVIAFGLLFAKLIGGSKDYELGNAFTQAFRYQSNHILLMVALLLTLVIFAWSALEVVLVFVPKFSKIELESEEKNSEIAKNYNIIRLAVFILLGLYCFVVFILARVIIVVPEIGYNDNGILPSAGFLAVFSLLAFVFCGLGDFACGCDFGEEFIQPISSKETKEVKKEESKKEEPKKDEPKKEVKKEEVKKEEVKKEPAKKAAKPKVEEVYDEEDIKELETASSLKESLKVAEKVEKKHEDITKKAVGEFLEKKYKKAVELNSREDYTDTGLPLADTHYAVKGKEKRCFIYVYETKGTTLFLLHISRELFHKLQEEKLTIHRSKFPKSKPNNAWYSLVVDHKISDDRLYEIIAEAYDFAYSKL